MEALLLIEAPSLTLAARGGCVNATGCANSGDLVRLVPSGALCDVNPSNWVGTQADTFLSLGCLNPSGSGLLGASGTVCAAANATQEMCGGEPCAAAQTAFARYVSLTPHPYDDSVPYEERMTLPNGGTAVAALPVPVHDSSVGGINEYTVCFKQAGLANWMVLNASYVVAPAPSLRLHEPARREVLTGEYTRFAIKALLDSDDALFPVDGDGDAAFTFRAKLVSWSPWADGSGASCLHPPGDTATLPFGAATADFKFEIDESDGRMVVFHITAPEIPGKYALCVNINRGPAMDEMSWWRADQPTGHQITVVESGIRWHVDAGNEPTNLGLSVMHLKRCPPNEASCNYPQQQPDFDTSPGADAAKVVAMGQPCSDATESAHIGIGAPAAGVTDLGPRDGTTERATFKVTFPANANDTAVQFKVCVKAHHALETIALDERVWVEVAQGVGVDNQVSIVNLDGRHVLYTRPSELDGWALSAALSPKMVLFSGVSDGLVGLAGAATGFSTGFTVVPTTAVTADMATAEFKLILAGGPDGAYPETSESATAWGQVGNWTSRDVDCMSSGVADSSTRDVCTDAASDAARPSVCPKTQATSVGAAALPLTMHLPLDTGRYIVCLRYGGRPWQVLPPAGGDKTDPDADFGLYIHPSYLEFDQKGTDEESFRLFDLRMNTIDDTPVPWGTWCFTDNVTCGGGGYSHDLVTIVNDVQVCPQPTGAPAGNSGTGWPQWQKILATPLEGGSTGAEVLNSWGTNAEGAFALPPASDPSTSSEYKVCVYKAGDRDEGNATVGVSRGGVVYQLRNRGAVSTGGGSGYYRGPISFAVQVTNNVAFDDATHFVEYNSSMEAHYSAVAEADLQDPITGAITHTPTVDTSDSVGFTVGIVGEETGGQVQGVSFNVTVMRCPIATSWATLSCPESSLIGPGAIDENSTTTFVVENLGAAFPQCIASQAAQYGMDPAGLQQPSVAGFAKYDLQYKSTCGSAEFGCGVRFVVGLADGRTIASAPQWINVRPRPVDSVLINGEIAFPEHVEEVGSTQGCAESNSPKCFLRVCQHGELCDLRFEARYAGAPNHAPLGNASLLFSEQDYVGAYYPWAVPQPVVEVFAKTAGNEPLPIKPSQEWGFGGVVTHHFTPYLQSDHQTGVVFYNLTFGTTASWVRVVVRIEKPQPVTVDVVSVAPLDVELGLTEGRSPVPVVTREPDAALTEPSVGFQVQDGSYLEALVPYALRYQPRDAHGVALKNVDGILTGWKVRGHVRSSAESRVLSVLETPELNMITEPATLQAARYDTTLLRNDTSFRIDFRVYVVSSACSRFSGTGGCDIVFQFERKGVVREAVLRTPVRIPASTVSVEVAVSGVPITPRVGADVSVYPGTWVTTPSDVEVFIIDEFHYGDAFALIATPSPTDGTVSRDGFVVPSDESAAAQMSGCAFDSPCVPAYAMRVLPNGKWGASWRMRGNKPCQHCDFTFHTTWGAGPESWEVDELGLPRGAARLTWQEEDIVLRCPDVEIDYPSEALFSEAFSLDVWAGVRGVPEGTSAEYPRWWVFFDRVHDLSHISGATQRQYSLHKSGVEDNVLRARMGDNSQATLTELYFGPSPPNFGIVETFELNITATGDAYRPAAGEVGSRVSGTQTQHCTARLHVNRIEGAGATATTSIRLESIDQATPLCGVDVHPSECEHWKTTTEDLAGAGVRLTMSFVKVETNGSISVDTSARNVTIVPDGGVSTVPRGVAPSWRWDVKTAAYVSTDIFLDSLFNMPNYWFLNGASYSFGAVAVQAHRTPSSLENRYNLVKNGVGSLVLKYGKSGVDPADVDRTPARHTRFKICDSHYHQGAEQTGYLCRTVSLWVVPPAEGDNTLPVKTAVVREPDAVQTQGVSLECGGTVNTVDVVSYVTTSDAQMALRYFVYDSQIEYTVSAGQQLVSLVGSKVAKLRVSKRNALPFNVSLDNDVTQESLIVQFEFSGQNIITEPTAVRVEAVLPAAPATEVAGALSATQVTWQPQATAAASFQLSDEVSHDVECPSKRLLQSVDHHYRVYRAGAPAAGWGYGTAAGAPMAKMPFPLEALVLDTHGGRVWGYAESLVKVTPLRAGGCGEGGDVSLYRLKPSPTSAEAVYVNGSTAPVAGTFEAVTAGTPTQGGVATVWVAYDEPCEACRLKVQLCYPGEAASACLTSSTELMTPPYLPDRTKITKPFSVRQRELHRVAVAKQTLPPKATRHVDVGVTEVQVGAMFSVTLEDVRVFGSGAGWAMTAPNLEGWTRVVRIYTVWAPGAGSSSRNKYGNGGLLVDVATMERPNRLGTDLMRLGEGCLEKTKEDLSFQDTEVVVGEESRAIEFFFGRPCSACEVWIQYSLIPPATSSAPASHGAFMLREYSNALDATVGDSLRFFARTCSASSVVWGTRPPVAVRKRAPFALTLQVADELGFPNYAPAASSSSRLSVLSTSNDIGSAGGRSALLMSSPLRSGAAVAKDGSSTVRAMLSRACVACKLSFGSKEHVLSVLTEPTQIIAIPRDTLTTQLYRQYGDVGLWVFEVYAADELGDRSYLVAGPTPHSFHPLYATRYTRGGHRDGVALSVRDVERDDLPEILDAVSSDPEKDVERFTKGGPVADLSKGDLMYNGIPAPYVNAPEGTIIGDMGTATVELRTPGVDYPLHFAAAGFPDLPTSLQGAKHPPKLDFSVLPIRMGVDDPGKAAPDGGRCRAYWMTQANPSCTFSGYLMGKVPEQGVWALSVVEYDDTITATVDCGTCATAEVTPAVNRFNRGVADFKLNLLSVSEASGGSACSCTVTVTPPKHLEENYNATEQYITIPFTAKQVQRWQFTSTPTLNVIDAPVIDGFDGEPSHAETVVNRSVVLGITGYDASGTFDRIGGVSWWDGYQVEFRPGVLEPPNCFRCVGQVATTIDGVPTALCPVTQKTGRNDSVLVEGYVTRVASCRIPKEAFAGMPLGGGAVAKMLHRDLILTARQPATVQVVRHALGDMFDGLYRRTYSAIATDGGHPAAVCGLGAGLRLRVVDALGHVALGDSTTNAYIVGARKGNLTGLDNAETTWSPSAPIQAREGVIDISIDFDDTTRTADCESRGDKLAGCEHAPWYFNVSLTAQVINGMGYRVTTTLAELTEIGPLYFVRAATRFEAFGSVSAADLQAGTIGTPLGYEAGEVAMSKKWLFNTPFNMTVKALDPLGRVVRHAEDHGSSAEVVFNPLHIPCINIDKSADGKWLDTTCIAPQYGGECRPSNPVPPCLLTQSSGWRIGTAPRLTLSRGAATLRDVMYLRQSEAPAATTRWQLTVSNTPGQWWGAVRHQDDPANPWVSVDASYLCQLRMVDPHGLRLRGEGTACTIADGVNRCTRPSDDDSKVHTYRNFTMAVSVVDIDGSTIAADNETEVTITGRCLDVPAKSDVFLGTVLGNSELDVVVPIRARVRYGDVAFDQLQITGACERFEVTATARGLQEMRTTFAVEFWPVLDIGPGTATLQVTGLEMEYFPTCDSAMDFIDELARDDFEDRMEAAFDSVSVINGVSLSRMCCVDATDSYTVNTDLCESVFATPEPPGVNDSAGVERAAVVLNQKMVVADFDVSASIHLGYDVFTNAVKDVLEKQLANPSSELRRSSGGEPSPFENAAADSFQVVIQKTNAPPATTPTPPTVPPPTPPLAPPPTPPPTTTPPPASEPPTNETTPAPGPAPPNNNTGGISLAGATTGVEWRVALLCVAVAVLAGW
eukprot:TRINITY_DN3567_c0_g3_i1.p1 TRINITY_DN3567_c0_g3~~TRINITY_DN3567_c0_g3_i1.p1  ORF type:complete len:4304 (+),score=1092.05 TRINITY_DN3567_c0_g3_i1:1806-12914(+)